MKVALVRPPLGPVANWVVRPDAVKETKGRFVVPPYADLVLGAWLEKEGIDVTLIDAEFRGLNRLGIMKALADFKPDVVGVSGPLTCCVPNYAEVFKLAKEVDPNVVTVAGGIHFTLTPDESLRSFTDLDFIVRGEGELTAMELLVSLDNKRSGLDRIAGLSYRKNGTIVHNQPRSLMRDLDILPDPAWDLLPELSYDSAVYDRPWDEASGRVPPLPMVFVITDRGCIGSCTYCSPRQSQGGYRTMSVGRAIEVMERSLDRFGRDLPLWIDNLTFNANREYTERLLDTMIDRGLTGTKVINARTDCIVRDADIMDKYKRAGIELIIMGAESTNATDLERYKKGATVDQTQKAISLIQENGMFAQCFFMVGEWHHSGPDIAAIVEQAIYLDPDVAVFEIVTPHPGTPYFDEMKSRGVIEIHDYSQYDHDTPVMRTQHLSRDEVKQMRNMSFMIFYANQTPRQGSEFFKRWNAIGANTSD